MTRRIFLLLGLAAPLAAGAQLPNVSTAAFGMGGSYTAVARGYNALAWNPAMLGQPGQPGFTMAVMSVGGTGLMNPIDPGVIKPYSNKLIPDAVKRDWLARVSAAGGESGQADGGATFLAFSISRFAFQLSSSAYARGTLAPDAFELVLFGNAGKTGQPRNLDFSGTDFRSAAFSTGAVGYGMPIGQHLSVGVTGKYIVGHGMLAGRDDGSAMTANDMTLRFPLIATDPDSGPVAGSGMGFDVGGAYRLGRLTIGATIQNVANTFKWDTTHFVAAFARGQFDSTGGTFPTGGDSDQVIRDTAYAAAPADLRRMVRDDAFKPVLSVGVAFRPNRYMLVAADARQEIGNQRIGLSEKTRLSAGLEFRGLPLVPLRLGVSSGTEGWAGSAGVGLSLGPVEIGLAAMTRSRKSGQETGLMLGVLSIQ